MIVDGARRAGGACITRRVGAGVQRGGRPLPKSRKRIEALCPAATARDMCANEKERGHRRRARSTVTKTMTTDAMAVDGVDGGSSRKYHIVIIPI